MHTALCTKGTPVPLLSPISSEEPTQAPSAQASPSFLLAKLQPLQQWLPRVPSSLSDAEGPRATLPGWGPTSQSQQSRLHAARQEEVPHKPK